MKSLSYTCSSCNIFIKIEETSSAFTLHCTNEKKEGDPFKACFICSGTHFYKHRDFNRALGCFIMLVGIVLVPKTYGISMPVMALVDWFLYKRTRDVVSCYKCEAEYRGFEIPSHINPFSHMLGEKFDKKRE